MRGVSRASPALNHPSEVILKIFLSLLLMLNVAVANAAFKAPEAIRDELNYSPFGSNVQLGTQLQSKKMHVLQALYDFNRQGGAVGTVDLLDAKDLKKAVLPAGAIVKNCVVHVLTPLTSTGSATVSFSTGNRLEDVKPIAGKASFATSDGLVACQVNGGTVSTWVKLPGYTDGYSSGYTREFTPTMKIGTSALDGGKISLFIEYILNR